MELSNAIKETISRFGLDVLPKRQFINLLDDVGAFKDEPVTSRKVMKGLLESGFGDLLCKLSENKYANWQNAVGKSVGDYAAQSGYKNELINRIATQLLLGVGLIGVRPKASTQSTAQAAMAKQRVKSPKELLYALKQEYLSALSDLLTITTDEYGHKFGYYTTGANTQLYVIESKIRIIAKEVEESNIDSWLAVERRKVEIKNRPTPEQIRQALEDLMITLERDYKALMEKSCIVEDDGLGLNLATFAPNAVSDLRSIENKIVIIGNKRQENRQLWIDQTKKDFLASKSSSAFARNKVLDRLKNGYLSRLAELDRSIRSGNIDFSDTALGEIRYKLINLGASLGKNLEQWCDTANKKLLQERVYRTAKRKKRNIIFSTVAGVVLLIGGWLSIAYMSSADARAIYATTIASANAEYAKGNYVVALGLFQKAENEYNASFFASSYKKEAHNRAIDATKQIIISWESKVRELLRSKRAAQAKSLTLALPANLVLVGSSEETFKYLSKQIDNDLEIRASELVDELLNDLYIRRGTLSESSKQKLDEMIRVVPDNYWLNFIKKKAR